MGTNIGGLLDNVKKTLTIENLFDKILAIDAFNIIYQFLNAIRGTGEKPLVNKKGETTSHLSGLLYRNLKLFEHNIKPIYCFDGHKKEFKLRWNDKGELGRIRINQGIIESSKKLLDCLGIPYIQAPGEGEAQCVHLVKNKEAWGVVSQDYDVLIYGGERLIRNLTGTKTRKKGNTVISVNIEFISLAGIAMEYQISQRQLVDMCILIGNDYFSGVKGIGDKTALQKIKKYGYIEKMPLANNRGYIITKHKHNEELSKIDFNIIVEEIRDLYLHPKVAVNYDLKRKRPDLDKLKELLIEEYDFSKSRVESSIKRLETLLFNKKQITLDNYLNKEV